MATGITGRDVKIVEDARPVHLTHSTNYGGGVAEGALEIYGWWAMRARVIVLWAVVLCWAAAAPAAPLEFRVRATRVAVELEQEGELVVAAEAPLHVIPLLVRVGGEVCLGDIVERWEIAQDAVAQQPDLAELERQAGFAEGGR